jgi:alanine racemase
VLKADGYGMGAGPIAARLYAAGCRCFFTATAAEAVALRPVVGESLIVVLHGLSAGWAEYTGRDAPVPVLNSLDEVRRWASLAPVLGPMPAVLHVDTGMARLGLPPGETAALAADPSLLAALDVLFVMSHLAASDAPLDPLNAVQLRRFEAACAALPQLPRSLASSAGIFLGPAFRTDLARPGAALFGANPTPGTPNPLRPAIRLRARVLQLRDIGPGDSVGYNGTWRARRPTRIATAGIGYADGWFRHLSNRAMAFFDGRPLPLVGRVSMDLSTYDATEVPALAVGEWLELIGPHRPLELVAQAAGTSAYEVLTALGQRAGRTYIS